MKRFPLRQFGYELERSPDVVGGEVVFTLDFLEGHPARQAAHDDRYRQAGASDYRFAMSDGGIENDVVRRSHRGNNIRLDGRVEIGDPYGSIESQSRREALHNRLNFKRFAITVISGVPNAEC